MKRMSFFFAVLASIAAWIWLSLPTLAQLHARWSDVGDSYVLGYPLIAAGLWLIWQRRTSLRQLPFRPSWMGVVLFGFAVLPILAGRLIQLQIAQQLFLPISLWGVVVAICGWQIGYVVLLPILLQYFGMPVWDFLIDILKAVTVSVSGFVLDHLHVPALIEGNHIYLTSGVVTVADSCSGLNLLMAVLLIAVLQIQMAHYTLTRRILFLSVAALIGLLDNWVRVIALVLIAHHSKMQNPLVYDHASFGWWIYAFNLLPLFWFARKLQSPTSAPFADTFIRSASPQRLTLWQPMVLIAVVIFGQWGGAALAARTGGLSQFELDGGMSTDKLAFMPQYHGYDYQQSWVLADPRYELTALTYIRQLPEKKLIYYRNVIAGEKYLVFSKRVSLANGRQVNISIVRASESRIVWWYYWIDGHMTTSPLRAKLYQLQAMIVGDPTASLITLSRKCHDADCSQELQGFESGNDVASFSKMFSLRAIY